VTDWRIPSIAIWLLWLAIWIIAARGASGMEERLLVTALGPDYEVYAHRTSALVPFVF